MKLGLLLIALGVGYKVYADASKEKGSLRSLGQWVGLIIMATSLVASALAVYGFSAHFAKTGCPFGKGKHFLSSPAKVAAESP